MEQNQVHENVEVVLENDELLTVEVPTEIRAGGKYCGKQSQSLFEAAE